jgi:hypothetical protein
VVPVRLGRPRGAAAGDNGPDHRRSHPWSAATVADRSRHVKEWMMAAMKPRTGDGPLEVTKEGRGIVMRVPLEGGGRLVVEMTPAEASELGDALKGVVA